MRVTSTRAPRSVGGAEGVTVSLSEALGAGLAPDGGLYVPVTFPSLSPEKIGHARALAQGATPQSLAEVAALLMAPFFRGDPLEEALPELCQEAFSFPAPVVELKDARVLEGDPPRQALLELFHGPTAAFKDYAARFLAAALSRIPAQGERHVLVATSGDTGSAVAAAFHRRPGFRVTILYPEQGVSPRQAHLLGCFGDNVRAFRVQGTFDDCQRMVKAALTDPEVNRRHGLTSANSISLGRLLPQMAYYAHAALRWQTDLSGGEPWPGFIVPSGNFGNALAGLWARDLGLPIGDFILATNANRALVDWVETGKAEPRPTRRTLANAMDVGLPSNLERLAWRTPVAPAGLAARSCSDADIQETLKGTPERWGQVVCPHTACGVWVLDRLRDQGDRRPWIVAATAHPAKFPEVVEPCIGHPVPVPLAMEIWLRRPAVATMIPADLAALVSNLGG
jgi:threonine synthase